MKRGSVILIVLVGVALLFVLRPRHLPHGDKIPMAEFDAQTRTPGFLVADFFATWCGPCIAMNPFIEEARTNFAGRVRFLSIDVDQNPELAARFSVQGFPTLMIFKDGAPLANHLGYMDRDELNAWLNSFASSPLTPDTRHPTPAP